MSLFDDLKQLTEMRDSEEITQSEFERLRADLLAEVEESQESSVDTKPPGWYNDPDGVHSHQAYWDGEKWTGDTRPDPDAPGPAKKPFYKRTWFMVVAILFGIGAVGSVLDSTGNDLSTPPSTEVSSETTATSPDDNPTPTTTDAPSTSTTGSGETATELPSYDVVSEEDVSFPGAVRLTVRVTVDEGTNVQQLRALAEDLTTQYRASHEYQALSIFFYHYPALAHDIATLGRWEDAPFGDWGRADEVERGDYSTHQPFDDLKDKDWNLLPSQQEVDLYLAYLETFDEMDTGAELPSDDDVFEAVASDFGVTPGDVESAAIAVLDWTFNG